MKDDFYIETERLILRSYRSDDLDEHVAILSNWQVTQWLSTTIPFPYMREEGEKFIEIAKANFSTSDNVLFSIIEKKTRRHMGGIKVFSYKNKECEVGYWLGPDFWQKGYAGEFLSVILTWIFDLGYCQTIVALTAKNNRGSRKLLENKGFIHKGTPPAHYAKCGHGDGCSEYYRLEKGSTP